MMTETACWSSITGSIGELAAPQEVLYLRTTLLLDCISILLQHHLICKSVNKQCGFWMLEHRISPSIDRSLLLIKQQLCSCSTVYMNSYRSFAQRHTVVIFRCSQVLQTFSVFLEKTHTPAAAATLCSPTGINPLQLIEISRNGY